MPQLPLVALLGTLYGVAVAVNFIWEVPQMAFYEWWGASWSVGLLVCLQAALGDGLLVLALYGLGCIFFRRRDWILQPGPVGYTLLVVAGMIIAVAVEMHALDQNRWAYNTLMPRIPGLGVGLVPVAQMMVLPTLIARLARWRLIGTRQVAGYGRGLHLRWPEQAQELKKPPNRGCRTNPTP